MDWNRAICCNNNPTRRKQGEKIAMKKVYKESNLEKKNFEE